MPLFHLGNPLKLIFRKFKMFFIRLTLTRPFRKAPREDNLSGSKSVKGTTARNEARAEGYNQESLLLHPGTHAKKRLAYGCDVT